MILFCNCQAAFFRECRHFHGIKNFYILACLRNVIYQNMIFYIFTYQDIRIY